MFIVMQQLDLRPVSHPETLVPDLPVLERHVGDFHFDLLFETLLPGQLEKPLRHLLVNLSVPLAHFQFVVVFLPHIEKGLHFTVRPVGGASVFLTVNWQ